jgi:hypothetical protein
MSHVHFIQCRSAGPQLSSQIMKYIFSFQRNSVPCICYNDTSTHDSTAGKHAKYSTLTELQNNQQPFDTVAHEYIR